MSNAESEKVAALLYQWEERKQLGEPVTPEALCHDTPELLPELRKRIEVLEQVNQLLDLSPRETPANTLDTVCDASNVSHPDLSFTVKPSVDVTFPQIGNYRILEEIGRGGMGIVYKAYDLELDRAVAIKMLNWQRDLQPQHRDRFRSEGRLLAKLHHEHIVKILASGVHEGQPYLVMDYYHEGPLSKKLEKFQEPAVAASMMAQVARAVEYAHQKNVLHRDLKPGNILLDQHHRPIVSDFGLAKLISDYLDAPVATGSTTVDYRDPQTVTGTQVGTPPYMAPEQFYRGTISKSIDIWAMGVILFEMLTGARPFKGKSQPELAMQVTAGLTAEPRKINPAIPPALSNIIQKCLATDPAKRYADAGALAEDLEATLRGKSRRWVLAAGGLALLGGGFEVGRRMKAKLDEERLDEEFAEKSGEIWDKLKAKKKMSLLDDTGTPLAYRWRTGEKAENSGGHLVLSSRSVSLLELFSFLPDVNLSISVGLRQLSIGSSADASFTGVFYGRMLTPKNLNVYSHIAFHPESDNTFCIKNGLTIHDSQGRKRTSEYELSTWDKFAQRKEDFVIVVEKSRDGFFLCFNDLRLRLLDYSTDYSSKLIAMPLSSDFLKMSRTEGIQSLTDRLDPRKGSFGVFVYNSTCELRSLALTLLES